MYNKIILIGNLGKDPELRYMPNGSAVATMRLCVNNKTKTQDETLFIDAVVFGAIAESCAQYLSKGNPVLVEGRLRERKWESDGVQRNKFEVLVSSVKFMPKKQEQTAAATIEKEVDTSSEDYPDPF